MGQCYGRCKCCCHNDNQSAIDPVYNSSQMGLPNGLTSSGDGPAHSVHNSSSTFHHSAAMPQPHGQYDLEQAATSANGQQNRSERRRRRLFPLSRKKRNNANAIGERTYKLINITTEDMSYESLSAVANHLVREILDIIVVLAASGEQEPPDQLLKLHVVAKCSRGWLAVVEALIKLVPEDHPLGPAVMSMFVDECPLTTTKTVFEMLSHLNLSAALISDPTKTPLWHRNVCIVLGCLAEKFAGQNSATTFQPQTLDYLIAHLEHVETPNNSLHALIALEKYARTGVNKTKIMEKLTTLPENPLIRLEQMIQSQNHTEHELGFCAQWLLDNMLVVQNRPFTYETVDTSTINVMLNHNDVSESLKISPDGLEARCDTASFESVRSTFHVTNGIWYYEAVIITSGIMQIGWATKESSFGNHDGSGIGDDEYSVAYDGCRQLLWHNAKNVPCDRPQWRAGDTFGTVLDLEEQKVIFYINGEPIGRPHKDVFRSAHSSSGFFAAASFMAFQHCRFNFGGPGRPFAYPPSIAFKCFNDYGRLEDHERIILPRPKKFELRQESLPEGTCWVCCADPGVTKLIPCGHSGYCRRCSQIVKTCPQCCRQVTGWTESNDGLPPY